MKFVKPSVEWLPQEPTLEGAKKIIEIAGRTCYKSEHLITKDSSSKFYNRMLSYGHGSVLEHGTIYLSIDASEEDISEEGGSLDHYMRHKYSKYKINGDFVYVTTNLRVIEENGWHDDLQYICKPTEFHDKRYTFRIITSRIISQQFTRHRVFSVSQESQRYCNYSKDKFGDDILFIDPVWLETNQEAINILKEAYRQAELSYLTLTRIGVKAEDARDVFPNGVKTEFIYTGFASDFLGNFHELRSNRSAQKLIRIQEEEIFNIINSNK